MNRPRSGRWRACADVSTPGLASLAGGTVNIIASLRSRAAIQGIALHLAADTRMAAELTTVAMVGASFETYRPGAALFSTS